jgi:hypothetical protein
MQMLTVTLGLSYLDSLNLAQCTNHIIVFEGPVTRLEKNWKKNQTTTTLDQLKWTDQDCNCSPVYGLS